jgi:cytosine/adenosine deaminase-related metal-dependent hydrolase
MTWDGHASLGWPEAGEIAPGSLADLVTVSLDSPRLAGLVELAGAGPAAADLGGAGPVAVGLAGAGPAAAGPADRDESGALVGSPIGQEPDLTLLQAVIFAASSADVRNVVIGGRDVVVDGRHALVENVPAALASAIGAITGPS